MMRLIGLDENTLRVIRWDSVQWTTSINTGLTGIPEAQGYEYVNRYAYPLCLATTRDKYPVMEVGYTLDGDCGNYGMNPTSRTHHLVLGILCVTACPVHIPIGT